ncbi:MAG TPA: molybdenum cofactor biosynthesis protein MoaE [Acidimicrobiales bacterium]|jgi:molybdopterin synthase catalytic subunit|nr:molybdenum cofactor biosynthesis protein MoaE [Acidimicrobiales bacterium]
MAPVYGMVLTGGASRRMGSDKATLTVDGVPLGRLAADALAAATEVSVEVGPGTTGLPSVVEEPRGSGPLAAVVAGWAELVRRTGEKQPAVVLACDLPAVTPALVAWLAGRPGDAGVVPIVDGLPQPLCARWAVADLERAGAQLAAGERSLRRVFGPGTEYVSEDVVERAVGTRLADVDTPEDLGRLVLSPPPEGDDWIGLARTALPVEAAVAWATLPHCGAVVSFLGTVRDHAEGREGVEELVYEAYESPARARMAEVVGDARRRWPSVARVAVLHRLGSLGVGDTAVVVVVSAPHRQDAFSAGGHVIDTVKATVPIWKYERWEGGEDWGTGAQPVRRV